MVFEFSRNKKIIMATKSFFRMEDEYIFYDRKHIFRISMTDEEMKANLIDTPDAVRELMKKLHIK